MRLDAARLGAMDLYRDRAGPLSEQDTQAGQILADVAAAYLFNAQVRRDTSATVARLNHRNLHDPLTGLSNRMLFEELLDQAVARARRSHHHAAVLFVNLDGFKVINARYGHHVGDQLLNAVAVRLTDALRPGDALARLGGDEFVVLCEDLRDSAQAESFAQLVTAAMASPFDLAGRQITMTASVGIAFSGPGQLIPEALLRDADFAMYQAKQKGGGRHAILDPAARLAEDRRHALERDLQQAQGRDQFYLVYQPIVDVRTGAPVAVEALLRWRRPQGDVMPDVVIPSAERSGLILPLGEWVLRQACQDLRRWQSSGLPVPSVAVNVSASQVMGPAFAQTVRRVLDDTGVLDPAAIFLEVSESVFLVDAPRALAVSAR